MSSNRSRQLWETNGGIVSWPVPSLPETSSRLVKKYHSFGQQLYCNAKGVSTVQVGRRKFASRAAYMANVCDSRCVRSTSKKTLYALGMSH